MKKYFVIIGAAILVMALAAPSMAQFKSWGHMEIQTIWEQKPDFNTGRVFNQGVTASSPAEQKRDLTWKHIAERFRFYLQYGDPKTVRAVIGFEADSQEWGELRSASTTQGTTGGRMGTYTADTVQLEVKHAYLDFVIPNTPVSIMAGIQAFEFGGRLFMNCDAPGVKIIGNFAPHTLTAFWWRENDGLLIAGAQNSFQARSTYGVNDTYGLEYKLTQKLYNVAAFGAYKNDLWTLQGGSGTDINFDEHPWWIGASAGFRPGNFDLFGQFIYNGGKFKYNGPSLAGFDDIKLQAWAAELSAKYRIGPGMFVGVEGFYATGNDADNADKYKLYQVPTNSESQSIFGNDRTVFFWMNAAQMGYYHQANLAFMGMWYGRANFEFSPTSWVRFNLNYLYIGDNTKGTPGVYTDGPLAGRQKVVNSPGTYSNSSDPRTFASSATQNVDKDKVGQELNLITSINIYQGFVYHIGVAVFFPGDVYDVYNTAGNKVRSADTAYAINSKLVYAF